MSKTFERRDYRVSLTKREMRERQQRRDMKAQSVSLYAVTEMIDRRFDHERSSIYEMLNMRQTTHYAE